VAFCFALNHLLDAEPWARERLAPFAGESLELRAPPLPAVRLTILPAGRVEAGGAEPALVVTLRPEALGGLVRGGEHFMRSVEVAGSNARLAAEIMALVRHLRWTWRRTSPGSSATSPPAAWCRPGAILRPGRRMHCVASPTASPITPARKALLVRRRELEALGASVAQLRDAIERLEKRIARLG